MPTLLERCDITLPQGVGRCAQLEEAADLLRLPIYRYVPAQFSREFVQAGAIRLRQLDFYTQLELAGAARTDVREGKSSVRVTHNLSSHQLNAALGVVFFSGQDNLIIRDTIFNKTTSHGLVLCLSMRPAASLARKFGNDSRGGESHCYRISDITAFCKLLRSALVNAGISSAVMQPCVYHSADVAGLNALEDVPAFVKPLRFAAEAEARVFAPLPKTWNEQYCDLKLGPLHAIVERVPLRMLKRLEATTSVVVPGRAADGIARRVIVQKSGYTFGTQIGE